LRKRDWSKQEQGLHRFPSMTGGLWDLISTQGMRSGADSEQVTRTEMHQRAAAPAASDTGPANSNAAPASVLTREAAKRFEYMSQVGAGGMGAVHCVRDKNLLREVALKVLAPSLAADPKYVRRFLAEAQIQAQLDHPNIAPVHDLTLDHAGTNYFTMRLVRGRSLGDWIAAARDSPTPSETLHEMLGAFLKVCDAVAFAHSRGVLHLDIKPENIIMEDFGTVYLMDWGLSRLSARDPERDDAVILSTEAAGGVVSGVVGSPSYMSPEQAIGAEGLVSERTDVFGLGAVLYAILAGRPLYLADSIDDVLEQARGGQIPPLPDASWGVPLPARIFQITRARAKARGRDVLAGGNPVSHGNLCGRGAHRDRGRGGRHRLCHRAGNLRCVHDERRKAQCRAPTGDWLGFWRRNRLSAGPAQRHGGGSYRCLGASCDEQDAQRGAGPRLVVWGFRGGPGRPACAGGSGRAAFQIRTDKPRQPKVDRAGNFQTQWTSCRVLISFRLVLFTSFPFCHGLPFGEPGRSG
jgi:serine/threonine protein kinase